LLKGVGSAGVDLTMVVAIPGSVDSTPVEPVPAEPAPVEPVPVEPVSWLLLEMTRLDWDSEAATGVCLADETADEAVDGLTRAAGIAAAPIIAA